MRLNNPFIVTGRYVSEECFTAINDMTFMEMLRTMSARQKELLIAIAKTADTISPTASSPYGWPGGIESLPSGEGEVLGFLA